MASGDETEYCARRLLTLVHVGETRPGARDRALALKCALADFKGCPRGARDIRYDAEVRSRNGESTRRRLAIALLSLAICVESGGRHEQPVRPWHDLRHRAGWVLLGVRDTRDGKWAVAPQFEIEGAATEAWPATRDPRPGELLVLTAANDVVILDYATRGEDRRLDYPGGRRLDTGDIAAKLMAGERLRVQDVRIEEPVGTLFGVWVRLTAQSAPDEIAAAEALVRRLISVAYPGLRAKPVEFLYASPPSAREMGVVVAGASLPPAVAPADSLFYAYASVIAGRLVRFGVEGEIVHTRDNRALSDLDFERKMQTLPELLAELRRRGARFPPSRRSAFVRQLNMRAFEPVLGRITASAVRFAWHPDASNVERPAWLVDLVVEDASGGPAVLRTRLRRVRGATNGAHSLATW